MAMIGAAIASRSVSDAGLRDLPSEWGGPRPAAAGSRSDGPVRAVRDGRTVTPRR
ncbi:MAG: hypothetical protein ABL874_00375 [Sphingopyxis sp.]